MPSPYRRYELLVQRKNGYRFSNLQIGADHDHFHRQLKFLTENQNDWEAVKRGRQCDRAGSGASKAEAEFNGD
jgi:hypothetical protein